MNTLLHVPEAVEDLLRAKDLDGADWLDEALLVQTNKILEQS